MSVFQELIHAANFQIVGGDEYQWSSFGPNARFLDFKSSSFDVNFSIIFDCSTQEVYQASLFVNESAFRWTNPLYKEGFRNESFEKDVDPRVAYDGLFFTDCDVFEDFIIKVESSFDSGFCDTDVIIPLDLTPEAEELFSQLPEGTDIQQFILESCMDKIAILSKQNIENWDVLFSTLSEKEIVVTIDIENAPISQSNIQELYNWISSLSQKEIHLFYSDKETAKGIISKLTTEDGQSFQYQYKPSVESE